MKLILVILVLSFSAFADDGSYELNELESEYNAAMKKCGRDAECRYEETETYREDQREIAIEKDSTFVWNEELKSWEKE